MYYTYVLKSEKDSNFYVGYTKDLKLRFEQHSPCEIGKLRYTFMYFNPRRILGYILDVPKI